jgi:hypothetical protein
MKMEAIYSVVTLYSINPEDLFITLVDLYTRAIRKYDMNSRGIGFRFPAGTRDYSGLHSVQTGSGDHSASCPVGARVSFLGVIGAGALI